MEMLEELIAEQHDRGGQYRMIQKPTRTQNAVADAQGSV